MTMTSVDRIVHGRYRLLSKIGQGGMGSVWRAEDLQLKRLVALKELLKRPDSADLTERRERALSEARALAKVKHRAIVPIHDVFLVGKDPWIVMEYIQGRSLDEIIKDQPLTEQEIARIALPVLRGLGAVHRAGIFHRDVKPANILVSDDDSVYLVDFGIAKIAGDVSITEKPQFIGTLEYMAPERIANRPASAASDLWSLGVTLFCALERRSPFLRTGDAIREATMYAILYEQPPRPSRPGRLADITLRLLCKQIDGRATAAQLEGALQAILDGRPNIEPPVEPKLDPMQLTTNEIVKISRGETGAQLTSTRLGAAQLRQVREQVRQSNVEAGAGMLLAMSNENAAQVISGMGSREAGKLIEAIADQQLATAGSILRILSLNGAGRTVDFVNAPAAALILTVMPVREAGRVLCRTHPRTAAEIVMQLAVDASVQFISTMPVDEAATMLGYVWPVTVASLFKASDELRRKLLGLLQPAFRAQVMRHL
jgi:eukaryotic-like serine/threonine-protein kinase